MTNAGIKEQIQFPGGQSFRLLRWTENLREVEQVISPYRSLGVSGEGNHWHYHQALELTLFTAGEGTRFVGDQIQPFTRGDLVLLGENLPHYWHTRGPSSGLSVQWSFSSSHPFWGFPETGALAGFFKSAARGIQFRGHTAQALTVLLHQLTATMGLDRLGQLFRLLAVAATSPAQDQVMLSAHSFSLSTESRHQSAMQAAIRFLLAHYRHEIRLQQLLDVTRMSKPTFSRQFKKHSGKTLNEFLQQIRIDAACHELATTEQPIIDLAMGCGFSQISFFNRVFLRAFGCSPSRYRQRRRRKNKTGPSRPISGDE
jgi:AraC-like DNA-binding protein